MCGRWNLPIFLFRDGLLTLINSASFIFVDDTFTIIYAAHKESFLEHLNSVDDHIQFTSEDSRPDGSMPFLDILIIPNQDGSLSTSVYRKPTHTYLYLQ